MPWKDISAADIASYANTLFNYEHAQFPHASHKKTLAEWEQQVANDIAAIRLELDYFDVDTYMRSNYVAIVRQHVYKETAEIRLQKLIHDLQSAKSMANEDSFEAEFSKMCDEIKVNKENKLANEFAISKYIEDKGITAEMLAELAIPEDYLCPIYGRLMLNPAKTSLAQTYDYDNIKRWLEDSLMDPVTGAQMPNNQLLPDDERRENILQFLESHFGLRAAVTQRVSPKFSNI